MVSSASAIRREAERTPHATTVYKSSVTRIASARKPHPLGHAFRWVGPTATARKSFSRRLLRTRRAALSAPKCV